MTLESLGARFWVPFFLPSVFGSELSPQYRYKGFVGMQRWVGLGVVADNIVNIGRAMEKRPADKARSINAIGKTVGNPGGLRIAAIR